MIRQLTIVHNRWDTRIWVKQVSALRDAGLLTAYVVADGEGDALVDGVQIYDLGPLEGRGFWPRVKLVIRAVCHSGLKRGEILHFHDALFLPGAIWLKIMGHRVVYDVHEDYPRQVLNWELPGFIRYGAAVSYTFLEWLAGKIFDGIVAATPKIAERFPASKTVVVQNFPLPNDLYCVRAEPYINRPLSVAYVGGISRMRGIKELVQAMGILSSKLSARLMLAGSFSPPWLEEVIRKEPGWRNVVFLGWQSRVNVAKILASSRIGVVLFHPAPNHVNAQPNKLFEYMSAGIPVIASDFPLWKEIVEGSGCGLLVNPLDPEAIAEAIKWLLENPEKAETMGKRGRKAIEECYNWDKESVKLISFYRKFDRSVIKSRS